MLSLQGIERLIYPKYNCVNYQTMFYQWWCKDQCFFAFDCFCWDIFLLLV